MRNMIITGKRNSGKTTVIKQIMHEMQLTYAGFMTIPDQEVDIGYTYVMKDLTTKEVKPISKWTSKTMVGIPETFSTLGVSCLTQALEGEANLIILDELGRFERNTTDFIHMVNQVLDSDKFVLAALKAEPIPYLEAIKQRNDVVVFDLDKQSIIEVKQECIAMINAWKGTDIFEKDSK